MILNPFNSLTPMVYFIQLVSENIGFIKYQGKEFERICPQFQWHIKTILKNLTTKFSLQADKS
jgi:hypothetical protein